MPRAAQTKSSASKTKEPTRSVDNSNEYFTLRVPKLRFQDTPLSPLWVILLLVFSFLLGMTTMKLQFTEDALNKVTAQGTANQQNPGAIPDGELLGEAVNVNAGSLPMLGSEDAKVTIIEFSDFQCPYCKRFYDETMQQLISEYVDTGKVRIAYRHMPLAIHPNAQDAGEASMCANDQDRFWDYHDKLFETFDQWTPLAVSELPDMFTTFASELGLNTQEFNSCLTSDKYDQYVKDDMVQGSEAGVTGTPTFFINGKPLVGAYPYDTFKTILDEELANN